jgi:uncharacterized protein with GYD domain
MGARFALTPGRGEKESIVATYIMLSTLTDEGRKTLKERPERLQEVNREIEAMGAASRSGTRAQQLRFNIIEGPSRTIARVSVELGARSTVQLTTLAAIRAAFTEMLKGRAAG